MRKLKTGELGRLKVEDFKTIKKHNAVVVLDNVRSAMNTGSFFRTADALALEKIHLCGITATPPHREINKTAIGATASVDWQYHSSTYQCLKELKDKGYIIAGVEQTDASLFLHEFHPLPGEKYAFVFGNEVKGLQDDILELLDLALEIPQFGTKHSFNVAVSGGIVLWHYILEAYLKKEKLK